ncbi:MAG: heparinase II/III family protein [bacterium]|nr:heparinase II/III family protein [bacterium]
MDLSAVDELDVNYNIFVADFLFGFNYQKNGMVKNLKKIEIFFVFVILALFFVLGDTYILRGENILNYFKQENLIQENLILEQEVIYSNMNNLDIAVANNFLEDIYVIERSNPVKIKPLTWEEDPYQDKYWRFVYYSLRQTSHLLYAWVETGDERYYNKLVEIVESFIEKGMEKEHVWEDYHGVAFRAMTLTNIYKKFEKHDAFPSPEFRQKLATAISTHGNFLFDEHHYEANYNHGVTEAAALFLMAINFPDLPHSQEWLETGRQRLHKGLVEIVDSDGVLIENSPYYHFYVLEKYWDIYKYSKEFDVKISEQFDDRINKMINYATFILQPDLSVPLLGASLEKRINLSGVYAEMARLNPNFLYVLTRGEMGKIPSKKVISYPDAGQVIMRSGWYKGEKFGNQTQLTFDIGPYRTNHSDLDALSFSLYGQGVSLMPDAGLYTYENGPYREYFHGSMAHNTVTVDGKSQKEGKPILGNFAEGEDWTYQSAQHDLYDGVTHQRAIALLGDKFVLIIDNLLSEYQHDYEQVFHLFPDANLEIDGLHVTAFGDSKNKSITIHQLIQDGLLVSHFKGETSPPKGLCSTQYEISVPCSMISYKQTGKSAQYITLLQIGENDESLTVNYKDGVVRLFSRNTEYTVDISFATFPIKREFSINSFGYETQELERQDEGSVVIIFDDGYKSILPAASIMNSYGIKGNVALISGQVGKLGYLSLDDVKMLQNEYGWNIINHSREHKNAVLNYYPDALRDLEYDVLDGAKFLNENSLNSAPNWYVYPNGATNNTIKNVVGKYYRFARVTRTAKETFPFDNPLEVNAFSVRDDTLPAKVLSVVDDAMSNNSIQFLTFHRIEQNPPIDEKGGYPIDDFKRLIAGLSARDIRVLALNELDEINGIPQNEWIIKDKIPEQIVLQMYVAKKGFAQKIYESVETLFNTLVAKFKRNDLSIISSDITFSDNFNKNEIIEESGSMNESLSPHWWINSGAFLIKEGGIGKTLFGEIDKNSKWQKSYLQYNAVDTDNGFHPQNIFRLITKSKWQNFQQTIYAKIKKYNLSESKNQSESNGLLLFNRYVDSNNLYYTGIRVDGTAVIKKKINGNYYTLAQKSFYKADSPYNRDTNPNIIPDQKWIGLRSEIKTNPDNTVDIQLFVDKDKTGNWVLAAEAIDDGKTYGGAAILNEGYAGIRTDFMDVEFDDYKIIKNN